MCPLGGRSLSLGGSADCRFPRGPAHILFLPDPRADCSLCRRRRLASPAGFNTGDFFCFCGYGSFVSSGVFSSPSDTSSASSGVSSVPAEVSSVPEGPTSSGLWGHWVLLLCRWFREPRHRGKPAAFRAHPPCACRWPCPARTLHPARSPLCPVERPFLSPQAEAEKRDPGPRGA